MDDQLASNSSIHVKKKKKKAAHISMKRMDRLKSERIKVGRKLSVSMHEIDELIE